MSAPRIISYPVGQRPIVLFAEFMFVADGRWSGPAFPDGRHVRGAIHSQQLRDSIPTGEWDHHEWVITSPAKGPPPIPTMDGVDLLCPHGAVLTAKPGYQVWEESCWYCREMCMSMEQRASEKLAARNMARIQAEHDTFPAESLAADKGTAPFTADSPDPFADLNAYLATQEIP